MPIYFLFDLKNGDMAFLHQISLLVNYISDGNRAVYLELFRKFQVIEHYMFQSVSDTMYWDT